MIKSCNAETIIFFLSVNICGQKGPAKWLSTGRNNHLYGITLYVAILVIGYYIATYKGLLFGVDPVVFCELTMSCSICIPMSYFTLMDDYLRASCISYLARAKWNVQNNMYLRVNSREQQRLKLVNFFRTLRSIEWRFAVNSNYCEFRVPLFFNTVRPSEMCEREMFLTSCYNMYFNCCKINKF